MYTSVQIDNKNFLNLESWIYAQVKMRWPIYTCRYRNIMLFELVQDCGISSTLEMKTRQSSSNPLIGNDLVLSMWEAYTLNPLWLKWLTFQWFNTLIPGLRWRKKTVSNNIICQYCCAYIYIYTPANVKYIWHLFCMICISISIYIYIHIYVMSSEWVSV